MILTNCGVREGGLQVDNCPPCMTYATRQRSGRHFRDSTDSWRNNGEGNLLPVSHSLFAPTVSGC